MTREELIIEFYSEGVKPIILKFLERIRDILYEHKYNSELGRDWLDPIFNNSNSNTRINTMY